MISQKNMKVLVVDDEEDMRDIISYDLSRAGIKAMTANSGEAALEILAKEKIDLVISDIRMPGMGGVQMLEKIREASAVMPIVFFITGFSDVSIDECLQKGAQKVFMKPFMKQTIFDAIAEYFS